MRDQSITILTLKTGLLTNKDCKNSNTNNIIPIRVCSISELKCLSRKFAIWWRVTSVQSLSNPSQIYIFIFFTKRDTKLLNDTQHSFVVVLGPLLLLFALLAGSVFCSNPESFRIERKLALTCLNTHITLQYKHQKRATKLIVPILTDINACNNDISKNNK